MTQDITAHASASNAEKLIDAGFPTAMEGQKNVAKTFKDRTSVSQKDKQVIIQPNSEPCYDFTTDGYNRLKKTVIIMPIMIEEYEKNKFKVTYECSRGFYCKDVECIHAKCDGTKKVERKEEPLMGVETFSTHLDR